MLELATLGLLQGESLHGYRLKQQLELFMSGCISVNYGAIYPLLRRLEQAKLICTVLEEDAVSGSTRKVYNITEKGKVRWKEKILEHPHESWVHARSRFAIKFFFFSDLTLSERIQLIEHRLIVCRLRLENQDMELLPPDPYQAAIWQRFHSTIEHEIIWLEEQLKIHQIELSCKTFPLSRGLPS